MVHGGKREIGDNKILVETDDGGVFLDFGKSYFLEDRILRRPGTKLFAFPASSASASCLTS